MADILNVLPQFDIGPYSHILPSLEKALLSTSDLLTLESVDVARRAQVPAGEVKKLGDTLYHALRGDGLDADRHAERPTTLALRPGDDPVQTALSFVSTLDDRLDETLGGGIAAGHLTELTGESAAGKTQFLLTLLLSVQLLQTQGVKRSALYVSTEAPLQTARLNQILEKHPKLSVLPLDQRPSLSRIQSTHVHDLEAQDHILRYQVPIAVERGNVSLVVIDSIAANYRAELDKGPSRKGSEALAKRATQLAQLGQHLRSLARKYNIAIVVANQVADRFSPNEQVVPVQPGFTQHTQRSRPSSPSVTAKANIPCFANVPSSPPVRTLLVSTDDPLSLDHQQRFFTGWGDKVAMINLKTPSLSLAWTNQLATRIALIKDNHRSFHTVDSTSREIVKDGTRIFKIVFSGWCIESETAYEIWEGGVRSVDPRRDKVPTE